MHRLAKIIVAAALAAVLYCAPAPAGDTPPSKETLRTAWESTQKSNLHTKLFRKTTEKDVYDFETDLFPYKGRLKLMNLLIDKKPGYYYYEDGGENDDYKGVAEVKLLDAPKEFRGEYAQSYETWDRMNQFHYDATAGAWVTRDAWSARTTAKAASRPQCIAADRRLWDLAASLGGIVLVLAFVVLLTRTARKRQKDYLRKYDDSMERQKESLDVLKQNLELQKQILAALKAR
jgi:hypothetical protein